MDKLFFVLMFTTDTGKVYSYFTFYQVEPFYKSIISSSWLEGACRTRTFRQDDLFVFHHSHMPRGLLFTALDLTFFNIKQFGLNMREVEDFYGLYQFL